MAIRTPMNPKVMAVWLQKEIAAIGPALPVTISTMQERVSRLNHRPRSTPSFSAFFAGHGSGPGCDWVVWSDVVSGRRIRGNRRARGPGSGPACY